MSYDYDFFVIGAGSGGVRAARLAASQGKRVAVAEKSALGGTCVNLGCVPKKLFVYASSFSSHFHEAAGFGWQMPQDNPGFDWNHLRDSKDGEIARLNGIYKRMLENSGADILEGEASFVDEHTLKVAGKSYSAAKILIATGAYAVKPEIPGAELGMISDEMFFLEELPKKLLVVGGGYIAVEFAGIMAGLGVDVTLSYRGELFLRGFDVGVREFLADEMRKKGVKLLFGSNVSEISGERGDLEVSFLEKGEPEKFNQLLFATGRRPLTEKLNLPAAGLEIESGRGIDVDECYRTQVKHIYAVGDVIDRIQLTPVALSEAMVVVDDVCSDVKRSAPDYSLVPSAIFSQPPIGTCGLSESQAVEKYGVEEVEIYESSFRPLKHTLSGSEERTFMKLIVRKCDDVVVGLHMCGEEAGEIVQGFAVAKTCGATKAQFDRTIGIHPSSAEEFVTMRTPRS